MLYQKILLLFVFCFFLNASEVLACRCIISLNESLSDAVKNATQRSTMVFAGKVVGFEYRKGISNQFMETMQKNSNEKIDYETKIVKFEVEKWWKGDVAKEVFLITDETKNSNGTFGSSTCGYHFKEGGSYLVYAYGKEGKFHTDNCSRTRLLANTEDLKILGEGKPPVEKKEKPKSN